MGADEDIHPAFLQVLQRLFLHGRGDKTVQAPDRKRIVFIAFREGPEVLFGQDGGRAEHRDLLVLRRRLE